MIKCGSLPSVLNSAVVKPMPSLNYAGRITIATNLSHNSLIIIILIFSSSCRGINKNQLSLRIPPVPYVKIVYIYKCQHVGEKKCLNSMEQYQLNK